MIWALLWACSSEPVTEDTDTDGVVDTDTAREVRPWTVAVFLNGDNNLEGYVTHDLNELEQVGSSPGAWVVVQADRIDGYATDDGDWTGTRRYQIVHDDDLQRVSSPVLDHLGEVDMGDPAVLADFLDWTTREFPSERLAVVLWDHGDGWWISPPPAAMVSSDDTSFSDISFARGEFAAALAPTVAVRGPIDLVGFDGCNLASFEVAHALREQVDVTVASEAWVGWAGLQYGPMLQRLADEPDVEAGVLGDQMAQDAVIAGENTWSAVDSRGVDAVAAALDALAGRWLADRQGLRDFQRARAEARGIEAWHDGYVDLADLARAAGEVTAQEGEAAALSDAVQAAVIGHYAADDYDWSGGLTVFTATDDGASTTLYAEGEGATWSAATRWDELLRAVTREEQGL